jgi:hypothetical protein
MYLDAVKKCIDALADPKLSSFEKQKYTNELYQLDPNNELQTYITERERNKNALRPAFNVTVTRYFYILHFIATIYFPN